MLLFQSVKVCIFILNSVECFFMSSCLCSIGNKATNKNREKTRIQEKVPQIKLCKWKHEVGKKPGCEK